jgi:hypothetical protein
MVQSDSQWHELTDQTLAIWKQIRSQIQHEDSLIHWRMTWLFTADAFLLTAFFAVFNQISTALLSPNNLTSASVVFLQFNILVISLIGAVISILIWTSIREGLKQLAAISQYWQRWLSQGGEDTTIREFPPLTGEPIYSVNDWRNAYSTLPLISFLMWLFLLIAGTSIVINPSDKLLEGLSYVFIFVIFAITGLSLGRSRRLRRNQH